MGQATGLEAPPAKAKSVHFTAEGRPGQFGTVGFATVPGYTPARLGKARLPGHAFMRGMPDSSLF